MTVRTPKILCISSDTLQEGGISADFFVWSRYVEKDDLSVFGPYKPSADKCLSVFPSFLLVTQSSPPFFLSQKNVRISFR